MTKEYLYVNCPICGKKLFKVTCNSSYQQIFIWCKLCKKEIEFNKEPKSRCR